MKKGLSPVIASVLLIALVLVLASIIFLWARGFISEQIEKFGQPVDNLCAKVEIYAEIVKGTAGWELEISNRGSIPIQNFDIKEINGGNSAMQKFKFSLDVGSAISKPVTFDGATHKIIVYPALLGNVKGKSTNKVFTCLEQGRTINF